MDRPQPVESMIITGELQTLPDGFLALDGPDALRALLKNHADNMDVTNELRLKHAALVDHIRGGR